MSAPNRYLSRYLSLIIIIIGLPFVFLASNMAIKGISRADSLERKIEVVENAWPSDVLKLMKIHNLQAESFPDGFQVEVKNLADKPIYFIVAAVTMPDSKKYFSPLGSRSGIFYVTYGNPKLGKRGALPQAEDMPIKPGETGMLRVDSYTSERFFDNWPNGEEIRKYGTKHLRLLFQSLSFGDGSGYFLQNKYSANIIPNSRRDGNREIQGNAFVSSSPASFSCFSSNSLAKITKSRVAWQTGCHVQCIRAVIESQECVGGPPGCWIYFAVQAGFPDNPCVQVCTYPTWCCPTYLSWPCVDEGSPLPECPFA